MNESLLSFGFEEKIRYNCWWMNESLLSFGFSNEENISCRSKSITGGVYFISMASRDGANKKKVRRSRWRGSHRRNRSCTMQSNAPSDVQTGGAAFFPLSNEWQHFPSSFRSRCTPCQSIYCRLLRLVDIVFCVQTGLQGTSGCGRVRLRIQMAVVSFPSLLCSIFFILSSLEWLLCRPPHRTPYVI